ncbi:MAG: family 10 glycosylhydrolase [Candidatus Neomarinimicrobiota bacterium]|nr:family 10 glycosylhydrolase [Candidatus Neomarinimicrobiota bacterium]
MVRCEKAAILVAFFVFSINVLYGQASAAKLNFRALWIVRHSMVSKMEIDRAIQFAKQNSFNHVFVQVRGRADALYNSQVVIRSPLISDSKFDPLEYAIQRGHQLGLDVHAWINVLLAWSADRASENRDHPLVAFPEWTDRSLLYNTTATGDLMQRDDNRIQQYLSPSHPGVRNHLRKMVDELLSLYDLDGIHLDYIRYSDSDFGYNMSARIGFEEMYGVDPLRLVNQNGEGYQHLNDKDRKSLLSAWGDFRKDAVTDLVRSFNQLILKKRPDCLLTVAVKPNPGEARSRYYQAWDQWLKEGLIDFAIPMNYAVELRDFAREIEYIHKAVPQKYWPGIVMGIAAYNQEAVDTRDKIKFSRVTGLTGVAVFSYDAHKAEPLLFAPIGEELAK